MSLFSITFQHRSGKEVEVNLDWLVIPILFLVALVLVSVLGCQS